MKYSCKSFFAVLIFIFVNLSISALTEADIISPVPGIWKNKQPLVISIANYHPDIEIYYTTSGSDPYQSGFAYDGPVLLEESGPVNLKIAAIDNTGKRQDFQISYRVQEEKNTEDSFIQSIISEPILSYIAGEEIKFPENYKYKIGFEKNTKTPFIDSKKISIPVESCTAEYIPVILSEDDSKTAKFRFVIHTTGKDTGSLSRKDVPFYITDWNFITFTNTNLIYSIDDSEWAGITGDNPKQIKIDRSIPHIIKWQDINYAPENKTESFSLPKKPSLHTIQNENGSLQLYIDGEAGYTLASSKYNANTTTIKLDEGLFSKVNIDAFYGDDIKGESNFSIYYNSVYQGELKTFIEIDKRPPAAPELISSAQGYFSREAVILKLSSEENAQIYYEIQTSKEQSDDFFTLATAQELNLNPIENKETFYQIKAYAVDKAGNKSNISSYSIVIDSYNYFVNADANTDKEKANGSKEYPFTSLEELVPYLNKKTPMKIQIEGSVSLPNTPIFIKSDCEIIGEKDARIIAGENSLLTILDTNIVIDNCIIEKQISKENMDNNIKTTFIKLDNSTANIKNTELVANFDETGTLLDISKSILVLQNSGITIQSSSYANAISAFDSELRLDGNRITSTASTAINFSIHGGFTELKNNTCKVVANLGRIAEFSNASADISNNRFDSKLSKEKAISPLWIDDTTTIRLYRGNIEE